MRVISEFMEKVEAERGREDTTAQDTWIEFLKSIGFQVEDDDGLLIFHEDSPSWWRFDAESVS